MKNANSRYFVGLDVGTDSVGYAVTTESYDLLKFKGEPMWGVHLFEEGELNDQRRSFRTSRRRLDRRQQRVRLIQELFAHQIAEVDANFFTRIKESALYEEDTTFGASLFSDKDFNDSDYNRKYPTIHHLIYELITDTSAHDVRLVYLAIAWLVAHRGHFLNEISTDNISEVLDINSVYSEFISFFPEEKPWDCDDISAFGDILKMKAGVKKKSKELTGLLNISNKSDEDGEGFEYDRKAMIDLLCGGKVAPSRLFNNDDYDQIDSFSLDKSDEELAPILSALGDDAELVLKLKSLYDWAILSDILQGEKYISKAKIGVYQHHSEDLKTLKALIKKYIPQKYGEVFRDKDSKKVNYAVYANGSSGLQEDFCKFIKSLIKDISVDSQDEPDFDRIMTRAEQGVLCPKQVNTDNRNIPYQVYYIELKEILKNASQYLPFLNEAEDGITVSQKIISVFEFRVPYFVGPLNRSSERAWIIRKADGKIYPWNFEDKVDLEKSEQAFIDRMTNTCTYLPDADVLPKNSLCYQRFQMLNELNAISVNGRRIDAALKQLIYNELCLRRRKITKKAIKDFLLSENLYTAEELATLSGVDDNIKSSLSSHMAFARLMSDGRLTEDDVEQIIERRTYTESKARFAAWIDREYHALPEPDRKYICTLKFKDFGRLSRRFLCELYGTESNSETGEATSILERMWNENAVLMEILSDRYTYSDEIQRERAEYFGSTQKSLDQRLQDMYVPNSAKRPIIRSLDIVSDIVKATGKAPEKIFVEMAKGGKPEGKGKRTKSRYNQLLELYEQCHGEDVRHLTEQLKEMGNAAESRLQSDRLFLYYTQFGKCMYSGESIDLSQISGKRYDIDHIYPRSKVKDDSVINNKVLVLSSVNGEKSNTYPIKPEIRNTMALWWKELKERGFITEEKYRRLTRSVPFSEDEQWGFINRQLVETRQSTKALAEVLGELYPETKIVYVKAGLVSEFRQEFDLLKSRAVNDLHHAKDAYLNIVVGNVYNERFTKQWFLAHQDDYNLKTDILFSHFVKDRSGAIVWNGSEDIGRVKNIVRNKNAIHLTRYAFCRKGGFFDQMPVKKGKGLVPRKNGLPAEKYGGYNKSAASFFMLVKYTVGKKSELALVPVELLYADRVMSDKAYAAEYLKEAVGTIAGKGEVSDISLPLGMRKIKIGTVLEFDRSLHAYITGKSGGGAKILLSTISPLIVGYEWEKYIKRLERIVEKKKERPNMVYSELYDAVCAEENMKLYEILTLKLQSAPYTKRPANPGDVLVNGKAKFETLDIFEQSKCLLQIIMTFGRIGKCNLEAIGGAPNAAVSAVSSKLSNWKKNYSDVRIVDMTASGLYQSRSANLLDML